MSIGGCISRHDTREALLLQLYLTWHHCRRIGRVDVCLNSLCRGDRAAVESRREGQVAQVDVICIYFVRCAAQDGHKYSEPNTGLDPEGAALTSSWTSNLRLTAGRPVTAVTIPLLSGYCSAHLRSRSSLPSKTHHFGFLHQSEQSLLPDAA